MCWNKRDTDLVGTLPWYLREQLVSRGLIFRFQTEGQRRSLAGPRKLLNVNDTQLYI